MLYVDPLTELILELRDETAARRNPGRVKTFVDLFLLVPTKVGLIDGYGELTHERSSGYLGFDRETD